MNKNALVGVAVGALAIGWYAFSKPSGYSDQYITLPSGAQAHCNRQGFREVRGPFNVLVKTTDGDFVECDARVGPEWDNERTNAFGSLRSPDEMDQALEARRQERYNAPDAVAAREESVAKAAASKDRMDKWLFARDNGFLDCGGYCAPEELDAAIRKPEFEAAYADQAAFKARRAAARAAEEAQSAANEKARIDAYNAPIERRAAAEKECFSAVQPALEAHNRDQSAASASALQRANDDADRCVARLRESDSG